MRSLRADGSALAMIAGRVQFSERQVREFRKTASTLAGAPWSMDRTAGWLTDLVDANLSGHSPMWTAPDVSWMSSRTAPRSFDPPPRALPAVAPVSVRMEDTSTKRRRISAKTAGTPHGTTAQQRDRNLARPTTASQCMAGATPADVSENGAPTAVLAPPEPPSKGGRRGRRKVWTGLPKPTLGCGTCKHGAKGCTECRQRLRNWEADNPQPHSQQP